MLTNPVFLSVVVLIILCLLKLNVILSLLVAASVGGLSAGFPIGDVFKTLIGGMGGNAESALSYILLGTLAAAIHKTGLATILAKKITVWIRGKALMLVSIIAVISCFSQNLIPVHIAFIPILIPPLLGVMNKLKIDRRMAAAALTFGLKAPYLALPAGFGLIFYNIIRDEMTANGMAVDTGMIWKVMWLPPVGMLVGFIIAMLFTYRKPREYKDLEIGSLTRQSDIVDTKMTFKHYAALIGALAALIGQIVLGSLPLGAMIALSIMLVTGSIKWKDIDDLINGGIGMMGFIAFVMLVAAGFGAVMRETGAVESLVLNASAMMGGSKLIAALIMMFVGLVVTMGIGTSFATIPILASIYVPLASVLGFSPLATIAMLGTAAALGDAGSPASDSTLGPTAGLNADGQHDHIWDTCVPTFIHFNIPLIIFGVFAAMIF